MFTDAEVFSDDVPSNWVKITSSRTSEPMEPTISRRSKVPAELIGLSERSVQDDQQHRAVEAHCHHPCKNSLTASTQRMETQLESTTV